MKRAAFFDLDDTIIKGNSGMRTTVHLFFSGEVSFFNAFRILCRFMFYFVGKSDPYRFFEDIYDFLKGRKESDMREICDRFFEKSISRRIYRDAVRLIEEHKKKGHLVVIVTNSLDLMVSRIREHVKVDRLIASTLETKKGIITGKSKDICYGKNKVLYMIDFAKKNGIDLKDCYAYSDNNTDIAMLGVVGNPSAVNPKRKMRRFAIEKKLKILRFTNTGG